MLNISGTRTYTGGTIAFGSNPGVFFAGTTGSGGFTISSAITGSAGLINANSVSTLNGDLSGLTGTITNGSRLRHHDACNTNTFGGAIEVRGGTVQHHYQPDARRSGRDHARERPRTTRT